MTTYTERFYQPKYQHQNNYPTFSKRGFQTIQDSKKYIKLKIA